MELYFHHPFRVEHVEEEEDKVHCVYADIFHGRFLMRRIVYFIQSTSH